MGKAEIEKKIKEIESASTKTSQAKEKKGKKIGVFIVVLVLGILVGLGIVFWEEIVASFKSKEGIAPLGIKKEKEKFNFNWALWKDDAGFAFEYPRDFEIDTHPDDESNYSFLTLTSKDKEGKIDIICNDTQYPSIQDWVKEDSLVKQGSGLETTVASMSAQKVALGNGREITGFIDWDEVIYIIDKSPEKEFDYWSAVYSHILESFRLIPLEGETEEQFTEWLEGFNTAGADVVEAVEIIE